MSNLPKKSSVFDGLAVIVVKTDARFYGRVSNGRWLPISAPSQNDYFKFKVVVNVYFAKEPSLDHLYSLLEEQYSLSL